MHLEYFRFVLSGLLILGFVNSGWSKPQPADEYPNDDDYQYDEETGASSSQDKSTVSSLRSTVAPLFEGKNHTKMVKPGETAILDCLVKNLGEHNDVLWRKDNNVIVQNKKALNNRFQVEPINRTLIIPNAEESDSGEYVCTILPQNLALYVKLSVTNQTQEYSPAAAQSASSGIQISLMQFLCGGLFSLLSLNHVNKFLRI